MSEPSYSLDTVISAIENAIYAFLTELGTALVDLAPKIAKIAVTGAIVAGLVVVGTRALDVIRRFMAGFRLTF